MFDVDSVASTGEPPPTSRRTDSVFPGSSTPPSVINPESSLPPVINPESSLPSERVETSGTVVLQETDSGYEASPPSTAGNDSFSFDPVHANPEYHDPIVTHRADNESLQLESDNRLEVARGSCPECGSVCTCNYSISTVSNRSNLISEEGSSSELSGERPSSLPIAIPVRSNFSGYLPLSSHMTRSNPVSDALQTFEQRPYSIPMTWPSVAVLGASRAGILWPFSLPVWENIDSSDTNRNRQAPPDRNRRRPIDSDMHRSRQAAPDRNRRRLIDSDASSLSSSEGEGPEDVFDAEEDTLPTLPANAFGLSSVNSGSIQEALPADMSQANSSQRNRSVSVNLPVTRSLAETIVDVGRSLRRLSDDFVRRRQVTSSGTSSRRFTIGDFVHYPSVSSNNHGDSDEDFSSIVLDPPTT